MRCVLALPFACWVLTHATGLEPVDVDYAQDSRSSAVNEGSWIDTRLGLDDTTLAIPVSFNAPHNIPLPFTANQVVIESALRRPPREMVFPPIAAVEAPPMTLKERIRLEEEKKKQAAQPSVKAPNQQAKKAESKPAAKPKLAAKPVPKPAAPAPKAAAKPPAPAPKAAAKQVQKAKPKPAQKKPQKKSGGGALENVAAIGLLGGGAAYLSNSVEKEGKDESLIATTPPSGIRIVPPLMVGLIAGIGIISCVSVIFSRSGVSTAVEEPLLS